MLKLVYADREDAGYPAITGDIHGNAFPEGWEEITQEEFSRSIFFTYTPAFMEYRQMHSSDNSVPMLAARLFHFYDGTGVAVSSDCWAEEITYYKFGCTHKYNELSQKTSRERGIGHHGMCWHVYECSECGHIMSTDSSD
jgi:hypothetical protein